MGILRIVATKRFGFSSSGDDADLGTRRAQRVVTTFTPDLPDFATVEV